MKKLIYLFIAVLAVTQVSGKGIIKADEEVITFYEVPLVCGAAPEIGCGSLAKPVLIEMEKISAVREAWLNREGTVYAIVWNGKDQTKKIAQPIFEKHSVAFKKVSNAEAATYRKDFREIGKWHKGSDVDRLSIEEASKIAETSVSFVLKEKMISDEESEEIKADVRDYFRTELVKTRSLEQLNADSQTTFVEAVVRVYEKHIGKERTDKIVAAYGKKICGGGVTQSCTDSCKPGELQKSCCTKN